MWAYRTEGNTLAYTKCQAGDRTQHWPGEGSGKNRPAHPPHHVKEGGGLEFQYQREHFDIAAAALSSLALWTQGMEREVHKGEVRERSSSDRMSRMKSQPHMYTEEGGQVQQPHLQRPRRKEAGLAHSTAGNRAIPQGM